MIKESADFFMTTIAGMAALIYLFEGTRLLSANGISRKPILMATISIIFCLVFSGIPYWAHTQTTSFLDNWDKTRLNDYPSDDWGALLDPVKNVNSRKEMMAKKIFLDSGKLLEFQGPSGKPQRFTPTEQDIKEREKIILEIEQLRITSRTNLNNSLEWLMSTIAAILFGLAFGSHTKRQRALAGAESKK